MIRRAVVAGLLAATVLVPVGGATALPASPSPTGADDLYTIGSVEIGSETRFEPMPGPATSDSTSLSGPRSSWCEYDHVWYRVLSPAHVWLFSFHQELSWCHTGYGPSPGPPVIMLDPAGHGPRSANWAKIPDYSALVWDYQGVVSTRNGGGVGDTFVSRWRQGKFRGCIIKIGICQTVLPWLLIVGRGAGTVRHDGGK